MRSRSLLGVFLDGLGQFWAKQRTSGRFNTLTKRMQTEEKNEGKEKTERMTTKRLGKPLGTGRMKKGSLAPFRMAGEGCRQTGTISACVCDRRDVETRRSVQRRPKYRSGHFAQGCDLGGRELLHVVSPRPRPGQGDRRREGQIRRLEFSIRLRRQLGLLSYT